MSLNASSASPGMPTPSLALAAPASSDALSRLRSAQLGFGTLKFGGERADWPKFKVMVLAWAEMYGLERVLDTPLPGAAAAESAVPSAAASVASAGDDEEKQEKQLQA